MKDGYKNAFQTWKKQNDDRFFNLLRRIERVEKELGLGWNKYPF
jgi:hypothetical protein